MSFRKFMLNHFPRKDYTNSYISHSIFPKLVGSSRRPTGYRIKTNKLFYGIDGNTIKGILVRNERSVDRFVFKVRSNRGYTFYLNIYYEDIISMKKLRNADI